MNTYRAIAFIAAVLALAGCGKDEIAAPSVPSDEPQENASPEGGPGQEYLDSLDSSETDAYEIPEWEKEYEWDEKRIAKRHARVALAELPEYVGEVWGTGGKDKDGGVLSDWAFVVPKDRIRDFQDYLRDLGVPDEYMDKDTPFYKHSERDDWVSPSAPVPNLNFLMAETLKGEGRRKGLDFVAGQTRFYSFENPNLERSELNIYFDPITGNTYVKEVYIDPDW